MYPTLTLLIGYALKDKLKLEILHSFLWLTKLDRKDKSSLYSTEYVFKKDFYGFTNNKRYKFIKLTFLNSICMNKCR